MDSSAMEKTSWTSLWELKKPSLENRENNNLEKLELLLKTMESQPLALSEIFPLNLVNKTWDKFLQTVELLLMLESLKTKKENQEDSDMLNSKLEMELKKDF